MQSLTDKKARKNLIFILKQRKNAFLVKKVRFIVVYDVKKRQLSYNILMI